jgi:hypothetical protein
MVLMVPQPVKEITTIRAAARVNKGEKIISTPGLQKGSAHQKYPARYF